MTNTKIQWCDSTFNPWIGCSPVSAGCANCYAAAQVRRFGGDFSKRRLTSEANRKLPYRWNKKGFACVRCGKLWPENTTGMHCDCGARNVRRRRVFCGSMMDWLDDQVPIEWMANLLRTVHDTPNLTWMMLSKRLENFADKMWGALDAVEDKLLGVWVEDWKEGDAVPANVWIGATVENQEHEGRIRDLLAIPAAARFLSCEPLLGPMDLRLMALHRTKNWTTKIESCIDWVIVGGESGPRARPCNIAWIRDIVRQCKAAGVPIFIKQDSGPKAGQQGRIPDDLWQLKEFPI